MHTNTRRAGLGIASLLLATASLASVSTVATAGDEGSAASRTDSVAPKGFPTKDAPPAGFSSWTQVLKAQATLDKAAGLVTAAKGPGFAGVEVSPETGTLKVFYKGSMDAKTKAAVSTAKTSVKVVVKSAAYSKSELTTAAKSLTATKGVTSISLKHDGTGLDVGLSAPSTESRSALRSSVKLFVDTKAVNPGPSSRGDDYAPYWGGARWNGCSTGFAVNHAGWTRMLSAGHCANNGNAAYDGGGQYMGSVYGDNDFRDTLLIDARSAGRIYDGGVGVGEFSKPVIGWQYNYVGDYLCQSGSRSGATCNIKVTGVNQWVWFNNSWHYPTVLAEQVNRTNFMGNGDSGGPVFALAWFDYGKTYARGTNTAINLNTAVTCTGVPASATRSCAWQGWFAPIDVALSERGATLVTG